MCRVQREKTWYTGQRGCTLWPCQAKMEILVDMVFPGAWELADASLAYVKKLLKKPNPEKPRSGPTWRT